jgi:hypothetical protein
VYGLNDTKTLATIDEQARVSIAHDTSAHQD